MAFRRFKPFTVAVFGILSFLFSTVSFAQHHPEGEGEAETVKEKKFNAKEVIFGHVMNGHEFHFLSYKGSDGHEHHATIPLPILLYEPGRGVSFFSSSKFHHGEETYNGYRLVTPHYREELAAKGWTAQQLKPLADDQIIAVDDEGMPLPNKKLYDFSLTRNVVQMFIALAILVWLMISISKRYNRGEGISSSPKGWQNAIEPVITFVRDEVAKPNLGHHYRKYMPFLLTIFFFILINNIIGLIPGTANVTGNIAFTVVLGVIAFIAIMFSSNKHYWGHIFNPPGVPLGVKFILIPVEFLSVFIKPFALIIRLFANMVAGHIIIICLISLIFIFGELNTAAGWGASPLAIAFTVFIYFIEVLVAFLQAFIFTMLTSVFIGQAIEGGHDDHDGHHQDETGLPDVPVMV